MLLQALYQPETSKRILSFCNQKDLSQLCLVSKNVKQISQHQMISMQQDNIQLYLESLINVYQLRKKVIQFLPKSTMKIPKNMEIKYKDLGPKIVKLRLKDFPRSYLHMNWQNTNLNHLADLNALPLNECKVFKVSNLCLAMNRSLIDPSLNFEYQEIVEVDCHKQTLEEIATSNEYADFNNMQEILSRQKEILTKISQNNKAKQKKTSDMQDASLQQLISLQQFAIILCHGGYFALGVYDKDKCILHKSDHKYVVRAKQGQRQLTKDSNSGTQIKSMGSQIRRENEKKHQQKMNNILTEAFPILEQCQILFLQAPGINQQILVSNEEPLFKLKDKIRSICLTAKKANYTEVERIHKAITTIYLVQEQENMFI